MIPKPFKVVREVNGPIVAEGIKDPQLAAETAARGVQYRVVGEHPTRQAADEDAASRNRVTSAGTSYSVEVRP